MAVKEDGFEFDHDCKLEFKISLYPLEEPARSLDYYSSFHGCLTQLVTSSTKLCSWHVYRELNRTRRGRFAVFDYGCYLNSHELARKPFADDSCDCIVLVTGDESFDFTRQSNLFEENLRAVKKKGILIVSDKCKRANFSAERVLHYHWKELSTPFKLSLMEKVVRFGREGFKLKEAIEEKLLSQLVRPEELARLMDEDGFVFEDGIHCISRGYNENYYIERSFSKEIYKRTIFDTRTYLFLVTGCKDRNDVEALGVKESRIQWIKGSEDEVLKVKDVFLTDNESEADEIFEKSLRNECPNLSALWFHYRKGELHLRRSRGNVVALNAHREVEVSSETKLIEETDCREERVVLISDDPGTGKSTSVTSLIKKIKDKEPNCWVGRIDLANADEERSADGIEAVLAEMLGMKTDLEIRLFVHFLNGPGKKKIFWDGFDEARPSLRTTLLQHFPVLMNYPGTQIWITTRSDERAELEIGLSAFSYTLELLNSEDQVTFLDSFWKENLKSEGKEPSIFGKEKATDKIHEKLRSILSELKRLHRDSEIVNSLESLNDERRCKDVEIDRIDFTLHARNLLRNVFEDDRSLLTRSPLHLFVLAELTYSENLKTYSCRYIHDLYWDYVRVKILQVTDDPEEEVEIVEFHRKVAVDLMVQGSRYHEVSSGYNFAKGLGILTNMKNCLTFTHRTFGEYFFSVGLTGKTQLDKATLENVFLESRFAVTRQFLDSMFKKEQAEIAFSKRLIKDFDVVRVFGKFLAGAGVEDFARCAHVWRYVIHAFENVSLRDARDEFIDRVVETMLGFIHDVRIIEAFALLSICLSSTAVVKVFDRVIEGNLNLLISHTTEDNISDVLFFLKRILCIKAYQNSPELPLMSSLQNDQKAVDRLFECVKEPYGVQELLKLLGTPKENIFHRPPLNRDPKVFGMVLKFAKEILKEETLLEQLTRRDPWEDSFMACCVLSEAHTTAEMMREIKSNLEERSRIKIFEELDDVGTNFLLHATIDEELDEVLDIIEQLRDVGRGDLLKEIILSRNTLEENVLHYAALNEDVRILEEVLKIAQSFTDKEGLVEFVMCQGDDDSTVYHARVSFKDLSFLENYMDKEKLKELVAKVDVVGYTCIHLSVLNRLDAESMAGNLRYVAGMLEDSSFEDFLLRVDMDGNTFLHLAALRGKIYCKEILKVVKDVASDSTFLKLMEARNKSGKTVNEILGE